MAIARALVNWPRLVLADEPTGNLDSASGAEVMELLRRLNESHGMTVVLVIHDEGIAGYADRVIHLRVGNSSHDGAGRVAMQSRCARHGPEMGKNPHRQTVSRALYWTVNLSIGGTIE